MEARNKFPNTLLRKIKPVWNKADNGYARQNLVTPCMRDVGCNFKKTMIKYITFGISISFISWIVGMVLNSILVKTEYYKKLSNLNFIRSKSFNKIIGIYYFKWVVKNTFFRFFNPGLRVESRNTDLTEIRKEMTLAEISHLIGFIFVTFFAIYKTFTVNLLFGFIIMVVNVLMNLYPSLLQQENKRRIDKLMNRQMKAAGSKG